MAMNSDTHPQRIAKLTALADVLAQIAALVPVAKRERGAREAVGRVLAEGIVVPRAIPEVPVALRDGWAVRAQDLSDAGPYSPIPLPRAPAQIDAGALLPADTDAVAPLDAIRISGGTAEAIMQVAPGEGVLLAGASAGAGAVLREAGEFFRPVDAAITALAGVERVSVRAPRVALLRSERGKKIESDPALSYLRRAVEAAGGEVMESGGGIESAIGENDTDVILAVGGTGTGREDRAVEMLGRLGKVAVHGIAVSPGETAAFGFANNRPVLVLPGRFDAALAIWLLIGRPLLALLSGATEKEPPTSYPLVRKISSNLGLTEAVLVRRDGNGATPLAAGYFPLETLTRADGWVMVPPESEGFPEGAAVGVRALPNLL